LAQYFPLILEDLEDLEDLAIQLDLEDLVDQLDYNIF
jgi:hypothetical protein